MQRLQVAKQFEGNELWLNHSNNGSFSPHFLLQFKSPPTYVRFNFYCLRMEKWKYLFKHKFVYEIIMGSCNGFAQIATLSQLGSYYRWSFERHFIARQNSPNICKYPITGISCSIVSTWSTWRDAFVRFPTLFFVREPFWECFYLLFFLLLCERVFLDELFAASA